MLVLSRHRDESIIIDDHTGKLVTITVVDIRGDKVRLGINAPIEIPVHRQEVYEAIQREGGGKGQDTLQGGPGSVPRSTPPAAGSPPAPPPATREEGKE